MAPERVKIRSPLLFRLEREHITRGNERGVVKPLRLAHQGHDVTSSKVFNKCVLAREVGANQAEMQHVK